MRADPLHPYAHYVRRRALGLLGRLDEATACMDEVLALDPTSTDAPQARKAFARARPG